VMEAGSESEKCEQRDALQGGLPDQSTMRRIALSKGRSKTHLVGDNGRAMLKMCIIMAELWDGEERKGQKSQRSCISVREL
jgi:hypothetical protein